MQELFAPPGSEWVPVSPRLASLRRVVLSVLSALMVAALVGATWLLDIDTWWLAIGVPVVVLAAAAGWTALGRNARSWGYSEREEDLYVKHGVTFRELIVVPYGRMQYVDVQAGPLEQAYGIASVHLHTASPGTSARIPGLPSDDAARLRDKLTSLGEAQAAGL